VRFKDNLRRIGPLLSMMEPLGTSSSIIPDMRNYRLADGLKMIKVGDLCWMPFFTSSANLISLSAEVRMEIFLSISLSVDSKPRASEYGIRVQMIPCQLQSQQYHRPFGMLHDCCHCWRSSLRSRRLFMSPELNPLSTRLATVDEEIPVLNHS